MLRTVHSNDLAVRFIIIHPKCAVNVTFSNACFTLHGNLGVVTCPTCVIFQHVLVELNNERRLLDLTNKHNTLP